MSADVAALLAPLKPYELHGAARPDDAALDRLEEDLGGRLPAAYRRFVKEWGGTGLEGGAVFPSPGLPQGRRGRVNAFYGVGGDPRWDVRHRAFDTYAGRIPDDTIPIGQSEGDLVLLGFDGGRRGRVFAWFHELARSSDDVHPVADSLEGFLNVLRPDPAYAD